MDERILKAINYINENLDKKITLNTLSDHVCMSPNYFHRCFKRDTGIQPIRFVEQQKVKQGYKLITNSAISIQAVSYKLGFNNYETFTRVFKKYFHISPADLRSIIATAISKLRIEEAEIIPIVSKHIDANNFLITAKEVISEKKSASCRITNTKVFTARRNGVFKHVMKPEKSNVEKYKVRYHDKLSRSFQTQVKALTAFLLFLFNILISMDSGAQQIETQNELGIFLKDHGYREVPLQKIVTGHLILDIKLNGIKGVFFLDTGAGASIVEEKQAEKFKLSLLHTERKAVGAGAGNLNLRKSINNELVLNNFRYDSLLLMVLSLDHVNARMRELEVREVDGIIGADILTPGKAIIDYHNQILYLANN